MRKLVGVAGAALLLASCGGSNEQTIETEDGELVYESDASSGEVNATFTGADGEEMTIQSGQGAAAGLPEGFALYPGASVLSNTTVQSDQGGGSMIMIESADGPAEVAAFYKRFAEDAGIEIKMEMTTGDTRMVSGEGPDGAVFSVSAFAAEEGGSTAQITVGTKVE